MRWSEGGEPTTMSPEDHFLDSELLIILRDDETFDNTLKPLLDASFVRRGESIFHTRIQVRPLVQQYVLRMMTDEERLDWTKKVIRVVSHSFPEENCLENNYERLRSILTPHVFHCLDHAQRYTEHGFGDLDEVHEPLCFMLISALGTSGKERWLLDYTESLLKYRSNVHNRCLAAKWRAYVYVLTPFLAEGSPSLSILLIEFR